MKSHVLRLCSFVLLLTTCVGFEGESACENTCPNPNEVTFITRCHCDSRCADVYNDCCYDSPYKLEIPPADIPEWRCRFVPGENRYFFMIDKCQYRWNGDPRVIQKCERNPPHLRDPEVPVISRATEKTYKNYYCAVCNDDMDEVISWQIKAYCEDDDITSEDVQDNLKFNKIRKRWGVYKKESLSGSSTFYECQIIYHRPIDVSKESVRECVPGLISSCPPSWRDLTIKRKCESYVNPVFWSHEESYRNIYCAVCNYQKRDDYWCELDSSARPNEMSECSMKLIFRIPPCKHGYLFNCKNGMCEQPCEHNKVYDHVAKMCRRTVCVKKGQVLKYGKCVHKG